MENNETFFTPLIKIGVMNLNNRIYDEKSISAIKKSFNKIIKKKIRNTETDEFENFPLFG